MAFKLWNTTVILSLAIATFIGVSIEKDESVEEVEETEWIGNSHNRESFLVATPFKMTVDGEELNLWYDQNSMVYFDEKCTESFLAPSGNPYLYMNLDGVVGFAEFYNEGELR